MSDSLLIRARDAAPVAGAPVLVLFSGTLFVSASLLFWVQPMFAKMTLPLLGGSPSVWTTAMLFFQATLLAGYAYAHFISHHIPFRAQLLIHGAVLGVGALFLPVAKLDGWLPPAGGAPALWLIGYYAVCIGAPFFALSASAPLLQKWFSLSRHKHAADPYFLYSSSNVGSMLALLGYPFILEPWLSLRAQSLVWSIGYAGLIMLVVVCGGALWRGVKMPSVADAQEQAQNAAPIAWKTLGHWILLAFAPSSLLLGLTTFITSDVASAPLFWVIPLALYLLSFILVFQRRPLLKHAWFVRALPVFALLLAATPVVSGSTSWVNLALYLAAFFVMIMVCHGELAKRRPHTHHLTRFYLAMSFGGMLGGVFNALIAPALFHGVYEHALAIVLVCALAPWGAQEIPKLNDRDILWPVGVFIGFYFLVKLVQALPVSGQVSVGAGGLVIMGLVVYSFAARPFRFALGIAALFVGGSFLFHSENVLLRARSFFGAYKVVASPDKDVMLLMHGTTIHGAEFTDPARWTEPLTYYHRQGPLGQLFRAYPSAARFAHVGVVGLGVGTTACYRQAGQDWRFFEIDPLVERIARDERFFHFMSTCAGQTPVILGDARLSLVRQAPGLFDLLILDAFSADSIPMHLMTREAFALYTQKLARHGLIAVHISSRFLDLAPEIAAIAQDGGLRGRIQWFAGDGEQASKPAGSKSMVSASIWVVLARSASDLRPLDANGKWRALSDVPRGPVWTDDHSDLLSAMR